MAGAFMLFWTLAMLLGGLALTIGGAWRVARGGPVPRLRRGGAIASLLMGLLFLAAPALYSAASRAPGADGFQMQPHGGF